MDGTQTKRYRLQITNLADRDLEFLVEGHVTAPSPGAASLEYVATSLAATVTAPTALSLPVRRRNHGFVHTLAFRLASQASAVYELEKLVRDEVRFVGYTVLRVPATRGETRRFLAMVQQSHPVRVLLHASREDYRDAFSAGASDFEGRVLMRVPVGDWLATQSIELAMGKAENEIEPEGFGGIGNLRDFQVTVRTRPLEANRYAGARLLPEDEGVPALLDLLGALENNETELGVLNELLGELKVPLRVSSA